MKTDRSRRIMQEHSELCFSRAFPRSRIDRRQADEALKLLDSQVRSLPKSQQEALAESGIAGTSVRYRFSFEIARWLARNVPGRDAQPTSSVPPNPERKAGFIHVKRHAVVEFNSRNDVGGRFTA